MLEITDETLANILKVFLFGKDGYQMPGPGQPNLIILIEQNMYCNWEQLFNLRKYFANHCGNVVLDDKVLQWISRDLSRVLNNLWKY